MVYGQASSCRKPKHKLKDSYRILVYTLRSPAFARTNGDLLLEVQTPAGIKELIHDLRREGIHVYLRPGEVQFRAQQQSVLERHDLQNSARRLGQMISSELSNENEAAQLNPYDRRGYDLLVEDYDNEDKQLVVRPVDRRRQEGEKPSLQHRTPRLQIIGEEG